MAENLKTTKYNDGTPIPHVPDSVEWKGQYRGAYCDYNNIQSNSIIYGKLYNWYVVDNDPDSRMNSNGGKNVCPIGWHVPADPEWTPLVTLSGGFLSGGSKLKESGTTHWKSPNEGATNESGFTALPGGYRSWWGNFGNVGTNGHWWCAWQSFSTYCTEMFYNSSNVNRWY